MKVLIDTSVVVAALIPGHVHSGIAAPFLKAAQAGRFDLVFSAHSLAETYAVLTRYPIRPPISPAVAWNLVENNVVNYAQLVTLSPGDYRDVVEQQSQQDLPGGLIYDAVIAKAAELANVDYVATFNVGHFQRVWPARAGQIQAPDTIPIT
ncbi:MAG: type II toxin-antitoxin system VapC family toxin [Planctomycetaceae bacterium]